MSTAGTHDAGIDHIRRSLGGQETADDTSAVPPTTTATADSTTANDGSLVGTIKSYLGFSGESQAKGAEGIPSAPSSTTEGIAAAEHGTAQTSLPDRTREPSLSQRTDENIAPTAANTSFSGAGQTDASLTDRTTENIVPSAANESFSGAGQTDSSLTDRTAENTTPSAANDSFSGTRSGSTGAVADPSVDTSLKGTETNPSGSANEKPIDEESTSTESAAQNIESGAKPRGLEHPEAIPTAGGEKLGKKHWGESKVVPENPKPVEEESVSGAAGQSTSEVADNTSKNVGSATSGPHGHGATSSADSGEKEKLTDKIKDKLHMGKK